MPVRHLPEFGLDYLLVCYDKDGRETPEADGSLLSEEVGRRLRDTTRPVTDVFVVSHGWKGDVPAAVEQYDAWIGAMAACDADRARARERWPDFTPLLVGFHWPSLPWGDESVDGSFDLLASDVGGSPAGGEEAFVATWSARTADTPAAREALRTLYAAAREDIEPDRLPPEVVAAYRTLDREAGLGAAGVAGGPEADREAMDPQLDYEEWQAMEETSYDGGLVGGMLGVLRQVSFWTMKARARHVGAHGGLQLLRAIAAARPDARLHLMGHSFGCIVVSSMLRGATANGVQAASVLLVQGALSLWSFASALPGRADTPGYFRPVVESGAVRGPIVVTTSKHDRAVGRLYPLAAGARRQVAYETPGVASAKGRALPTYGAVGAFGVQGDGLTVEALDIARSLDTDYAFQPGRVYNVRADDVIRTGGGFSGAHSDIAHPEVGHLFWSAILATAA